MTAGLDLAAMPEQTALASIEWAEARAVIRDVICPAGDDVILEVIGQTGKTGIDCPFGWPVPAHALRNFCANSGLSLDTPVKKVAGKEGGRLRSGSW